MRVTGDYERLLGDYVKSPRLITEIHHPLSFRGGDLKIRETG
jgi:hypothetical protein